MLAIRKADVAGAFQSANELSALVYTESTDLHDDDNGECRLSSRERVCEMLRRRAELAEGLERSLRWITNLPLCLGKGATGLATKVRLVLHLFWMLAPPPRLPNMARQLGDIISFTSDMGTELGISDFEPHQHAQ